jgi:hypothetical protein
MSAERPPLLVWPNDHPVAPGCRGENNPDNLRVCNFSTVAQR